MANSFGTETPPAPENPDGGNALMSQRPGPAAQPAAPVAGGPQQPPPGPNAAQTMSALRHFDAIKRQLAMIAGNPALGKSNVKGKIIDGMTKLVAEGFMTTTAAVDELSKVPSDPLQQMQWVKAQIAQTQKAEDGILDHFGMSNPHMGTVAEHFASTKMPPMDDHQDHLAALSANYKGTK